MGAQDRSENTDVVFAVAVSGDPGIPAGFQPLCPFSERACRRGEGFVALFIGKWCVSIWLVYKCHIEWALFPHVDEDWMQILMHTL